MLDDQTGRLFAGSNVNSFGEVQNWARDLAHLLTACIRLRHEGGLTLDAGGNPEAGFIKDDANEDGSVLIINQTNASHTTVNDAHALYVQEGNVRIDNDVFFNGGQINFIGNNVVWTAVTWTAASTVTMCGTYTSCTTLVVDWSTATSLKIPTSAAPTISANGHFGFDTTVTDWSHGIPKAWIGEELGFVVMPIAEFAGMSDGDVPAYVAASDEFQMQTVASLFPTAVTAAAIIADNAIVRGDGGARGVQSSSASVSDAGLITANGATLAGGTTTIGNIAGTVIAQAASSYDFGGAASFEIPNATTVSVSVTGQIGVDTSVTDWSHGILEYNGGEVLGVVAMPIANFTSPTDGFVPKYVAASDEFQLLSPTAPDVVTSTGTIADNTLMRGDGGSRGSQSTGISVDDSNNMTGAASIAATTLQAGNTGLKALDTNASHALVFKPGSDLTAEHTLTVTTGDADRTLQLDANLTVSVATTLNSGVYTPTLTNVANLAASTAYQAQWSRNGSVVNVTGKVDVDPTLTATATQLGISLPVASNIGAAEDVGGVAFATGIAGMGGGIIGDAANDRAELNWVATDVTNQPVSYSFSYRII